MVLSGVAGAVTQDLLLGFASPYVWLPGLSVLAWGLSIGAVVSFGRPDLKAGFVNILYGFAMYVLVILEYQVLQMVKTLIAAGLPLVGPWGELLVIPCSFLSGMFLIHYYVVKASLKSGKDKSKSRILFYAPGSIY